MSPLHLLAFGWAAGALGSFPGVYEIMARKEDHRMLGWWEAILLAVFVALIWPVAWGALVISVIRRAIR